MIEGDGERRPAVKVSQTLGVALGNALEFYDFLVFSFFALQIGQTYFPGDSPQSSLLAALATFGSGFLMRPLGAFIIGGLGDRLGRRPMMMLSFALIGLATFGVALTPSYKDIGLGAPVVVIVCRLVQGFALGGEMGVSTAFLAEAGPRSKRGSYIALQYAGQYAAILVAGLVGVGLARTMDDIALARWGWRIAMGLGVLIVPVGLILRGRLPETLHPKTAAGAPPRIATYARKATVGFVLLLSTTISTYVLNFMTTFAKTILKLSSDISFGATVVVGVAGLLGALAVGPLSDRLGRRPLMIWPTMVGCVITLPGFWLITHVRAAWSLYLVTFALRLIFAVGMTAAFINVTESLPRRIRSGALAVIYAVATSVFGGTTQFVIAWLTQATGDPLMPAWYMFAASTLGLCAMALTRETAPSKASPAATARVSAAGTARTGERVNP